MRTRDEILQGEDENKFMTKCYFDKSLFFSRVLGFELKPFHLEWLSLLDNYDRIAIRAPTGFGKTAIFGVGFPLWLSYYKPKAQSLIISKTIRTQSANVLDDIKLRIEDNEILKELKPTDTKKEWTKEKLITSNNSKVFYSSYSVNVRGTHVDYIFGDEASTWLGTENYFENVVTRAVSKKGRIAMVSTPVSPVDLMARLSQNPSYFFKDYPAIVNYKQGNYATGQSIWPERFPIELLMKIRREIGSVMFEKNYMVNPKAESENAIFSAESVEKCFDHNIEFSGKDLGGTCFMGCDFAIASGPTADFDCFVVVEVVAGKVVIKHGEVHKGMAVPAKVQRILQLSDQFNPQKIVIDESHIGAAILQDLRPQGIFVVPQSFQSKARNKLLMNLKHLIDNQVLVIPKKREIRTKTFVDRLEEELIGFKEEKSELGVVRIKSTTAHDDTVMALAMACSGHKFQKPFVDHISVR